MKITRMLSTLAVAALATMSNTATAAPGDLDLTFGGTGKVTTDFGGGASGRSVAVQSDGRIVVAGFSSSTGGFALARYNTNGSLDTSFNSTGKVTTNFSNGDTASGEGVALQSDGKIVVAGYSYDENIRRSLFAVARYNTNGSLDPTFGSSGKVTTSFGTGTTASGRSMALESDGKIVVAGWVGIPDSPDLPFDTVWAVARYNANGSLDSSFNGAGMVTTNLPNGDSASGDGVVLQSDGRIVVAGWYHHDGVYDFGMVRYNANGSLDTSFGSGGKVSTDFANTTDIAHGVALQGDGKIVVAGYSGTDFALVRYNANGSLDTSFNGSGKVTTAMNSGYDSHVSVAVQSDHKIVVAGNSHNGGDYDIALVRYNADGTLDATFNGTGIVTTGITAGYDEGGASVVVQSDEKIVVAGDSFNAFAIVRYEGGLDTDGDGIIDRFETGTGIYVSPEDTGTDPNKADTDDDGLNDGQEVNTYHSNPNIKDTDSDGFNDGFEVSTGFSPTSATSTPDALSSIVPAVEYRFNAALGVSYRIEASFDLQVWTTIETDIIGTGGVISRLYSIEGQPKRFFRSRRN